MTKRTGPSLLRKYGKKFEETVFRGAWARNLARGMGLQQFPRVKRLSYDMGLEKSDRKSVKVAFVSDIHSGRMTHPSVILETGRILRDNEHDLLLLGGDYIFLSPDEIGLVCESLMTVSPPLGKYGVLGNHDRWIGRGELTGMLGVAGVKILVNEEVRFGGDYEYLSVYGLDDVEWGEPAFPGSRTSGNPGLSILLSHSPETLSYPECRGFDFAFFGHTHAGQIAPPFGKPFLPFKDKYSRAFPYGQYDNGGGNGPLPVYVTSGVGCVWLPVRLFAPPEVVFMTFR